ncbi:hypothetical protein TWF730_004472 [Orbilia blumenaviensis]|uniref:Uncharacterized protein n=1 Tax=Orbilia blumenaviensis TaxID=1796055 RepID=A0AAV9TYN8_9PEZI
MYSHTPNRLFLLWLSISLPLVLWDFSYVMLRPHSMPGGKWHLPWKPYALYCEIDLVYGFKHYYDGEGFNPAQSAMNFVEVLAYCYYLHLVRSGGKGGMLLGADRVVGRTAGKAVVVGLVACTATFWKTVIYWLVEVLGGYKHIAHNDLNTIFWFWVLPNGPWLVLPLYGIYQFGTEVMDALAGDSAATKANGVKAQ